MVLAFVLGSVYYSIRIPWIGVLSLALLSYLNPHRYAWGFMVNFPVYQVVFLSTVFGLLMNPNARRPFPLTWETIMFILLLTWFTLTTYVAEPDFPIAAQDQWLKVMKIYISIFPTFLLIRNRTHFKWLIIIITVSFGLIGMKGGLFALSSGFNYRVWGPAKSFYAGNNEIALALNMILPLCLLCRKYTENVYLKWFFLAMFILSMCSIISTHSRGGLVTLVAVLGAMMAIGNKKWLFISIPIVAAGVLLGPSFLPDHWTERMQTIETYEEDASVQGRFEAWNHAIERAQQDPLTGGGFETFRSLAHDAHSAYFELLGEHGYIALALWFCLTVGTIISLQMKKYHARRAQSTMWIKDYASGIQLSIFAYFVGSAFLGTAYWDILYQLVGLSVVLKYILFRELSQASTNPEAY